MTTKKPSRADRVGYARGLAPKLAAETDALNAEIARAEKEFASLGLGVSAFVELSDDADAERGISRQLGFRKEGSEWRLVIDISYETAPEESDTLLLTKASRAMRLHAASYFDALLDQLILAAEGEVKKVVEARQKITAVVNEVEEIPF